MHCIKETWIIFKKENIGCYIDFVNEKYGSYGHIRNFSNSYKNYLIFRIIFASNVQTFKLDILLYKASIGHLLPCTLEEYIFIFVKIHEQ